MFRVAVLEHRVFCQLSGTHSLLGGLFLTLVREREKIYARVFILLFLRFLLLLSKRCGFEEGGDERENEDSFFK